MDCKLLFLAVMMAVFSVNVSGLPYWSFDVADSDKQNSDVFSDFWGFLFPGDDDDDDDDDEEEKTVLTCTNCTVNVIWDNNTTNGTGIVPSALQNVGDQPSIPAAQAPSAAVQPSNPSAPAGPTP